MTKPSEPTTHIEVHEVDAQRWPDFERLFESRGGPKWCWCRMFRADEYGKMPHARADMKQAIFRKIESGVRVGLLAYRDGEPVAWCSTAPRATFVHLGGPEPAPSRPPSHTENEDPNSDPDSDSVWSITCFYVKSSLRRHGLMSLLIEEAVRSARENGASVVEAYPVDFDSPSYLFCGFVPVFAAHGFQEVARAGLRRHVMRRAV